MQSIEHDVGYQELIEASEAYLRDEISLDDLRLVEERFAPDYRAISKKHALRHAPIGFVRRALSIRKTREVPGCQRS